MLLHLHTDSEALKLIFSHIELFIQNIDSTFVKISSFSNSNFKTNEIKLIDEFSEFIVILTELFYIFPLEASQNLIFGVFEKVFSIFTNWFSYWRPSLDLSNSSMYNLILSLTKCCAALIRKFYSISDHIKSRDNQSPNIFLQNYILNNKILNENSFKVLYKDKKLCFTERINFIFKFCSQVFRLIHPIIMNCSKKEIISNDLALHSGSLGLICIFLSKAPFLTANSEFRNLYYFLLEKNVICNFFLIFLIY